MDHNIRLNWEGLVAQAKSRRKKQRLTQEIFALIAGVSKPTLCDFEKGRDTVTIQSVRKILKALGRD